MSCSLIGVVSTLSVVDFLKQLRFEFGKLEQNQVNVRAFDGVQRDTLGAINLVIQMGPVEFNAKFQVLDMDTSYNILLGRPLSTWLGLFLLLFTK